MTLTITALGHDDPAFLAPLNRALTDLLERFRPRDVFIVQVTDAFGDRWCGTGGRFLGSRDAQTVVSREVPTLPPFPPDRIASERRFRLALDFSTYVMGLEAEPLHVHSLAGLEYQRKLSMFTEAGIFLWYSGATLSNDRGTLMVQVHTPEFGDVWHATFTRVRHGWEFETGLGVTREAFE